MKPVLSRKNIIDKNIVDKIIVTFNFHLYFLLYIIAIEWSTAYLYQYSTKKIRIKNAKTIK